MKTFEINVTISIKNGTAKTTKRITAEHAMVALEEIIKEFRTTTPVLVLNSIKEVA